MPEGIECHMVPLMSRASLEGDVGHNACRRVCICVCFCASTCAYVCVYDHSYMRYKKRCRDKKYVSSSLVCNIWRFMCVLECKAGFVGACVCVCEGGVQKGGAQGVCMCVWTCACACTSEDVC